MITNTDKGLGPAIMEITKYIDLCLRNHLNNKNNYCEVDETEAAIIDETNFRWICERFIDFPVKGTVTKSERKFFIASLCGDRNKDGSVNKLKSLLLPYFYILPKVHKDLPPKVKFESTRPVVSGVGTVMEPLSKWTDLQLQKVVHLCPAYTMDS